jgi:hypothetical protein
MRMSGRQFQFRHKTIVSIENRPVRSGDHFRKKSQKARRFEAPG